LNVIGAISLLIKGLFDPNGQAFLITNNLDKTLKQSYFVLCNHFGIRQEAHYGALDVQRL